MPWTIRRGLVALALALLAMPALAQAPSWPTRPIRWILGFAPAGAGDITARLVAPRLSEALGQPVVIENRPSAGGMVAAEAVARAEPDGHTLLLVTSTSSAAVAYFRTLPFDTERDFAPVGLISTFGHVLMVPPNSPHADLASFVAAARARPGAFNIGSISVGTTQAMSSELFRGQAGIRMERVTYRGTPELVNAVAAGDVQLGVETLPPLLGQLGPGGRIRALAISSPTRFPSLPNVPTTAELGMPGYQPESWNGVQVPAHTPAPIVERLNRELNRILATPDIARRLTELGLEPKPGTPEALQARLVADIALWRGVVADAGIERQ